VRGVELRTGPCRILGGLRGRCVHDESRMLAERGRVGRGEPRAARREIGNDRVLRRLRTAQWAESQEVMR
jgi:hypothetical protein